MSSKAEQRAATRARLLAAARPLFAARGYTDVGTEEIVRAAGVTRGALYHQFADKRDLFRAVFEEVEGELVARLAAGEAAAAEDPFGALRAGLLTWLAIAGEPEVERIVLLDAPAVLGWLEWREIGERYGLGLVVAALQGAMDSGAIAPQPVRALSHVIIGALDEAALYVARSDDAPVARAEAEEVLERLLDGLRPR